jgi:predicted transposase YbfD/YdcC
VARSTVPLIPRRRCAAVKLAGKKKWSRETVYAITSLTATQVSPGGLAGIIRGHWMIEDRLHWVRDMDFDEDRPQVRTASGPRIMASLRNLAVTILRLAGATNIAAALRYHARKSSRPLGTIMKC